MGFASIADYQNGKSGAVPKATSFWPSHIRPASLTLGLERLPAGSICSSLVDLSRHRTQITDSTVSVTTSSSVASASCSHPFFVHAQSLDAPLYSQRNRIS